MNGKTARTLGTREAARVLDVRGVVSTERDRKRSWKALNHKQRGKARRQIEHRANAEIRRAKRIVIDDPLPPPSRPSSVPIVIDGRAESHHAHVRTLAARLRHG
jgi:hypothetical protein